jgi:acetoacetyl-CoA reductase
MAHDKHRVALVTGGMGGLGEAICMKLAALGYTVVTTHSPGNAKAHDWLESMKKAGFTFHAYPCDVVDWDSCVACVAQVAKDVGAVDVLVNNAGITRDMTFKKMDKASWDLVIRTNLDSCFNMTKQVCDGMVDRGWGRIINISSVNGQKGAFGQANYSAAKAGMIGLTKSLAREFAGRSVTVNAVAPGFIKTDMTTEFVNKPEVAAKILEVVPLKRFGEASDIANMCAYLCSEEAGYVTGQVFTVDGGMAM